MSTSVKPKVLQKLVGKRIRVFAGNQVIEGLLVEVANRYLVLETADGVVAVIVKGLPKIEVLE
jgi:RNase P/RNase MRP subunit p29